jgi:hypothetical protein
MQQAEHSERCNLVFRQQGELSIATAQLLATRARQAKIQIFPPINSQLTKKSQHLNDIGIFKT